MKQSVQFAEDETSYKIVLIDEEKNEYLLEKKVEPDDKTVIIGLTKQGQVVIKEVDFPKNSVYTSEDVQDTANRIQQRFHQEGCRSCTVIGEANNTKQTFILPTPKQILNDIFDRIQ
ncbi:hypothetical protein SBF1_4590002 [Candidatus Desulfosporosinus infrequens]|uniref:Uncharacterized protein n=1 Tax=Candidatus Desulfosporosinus infrequens TaxID=2043169 RepID=A0A2U3LCF5_9FIRM|nr:hypothetical protein SBF1_4590002 [Candidatus Desulfosporosinus infrequens]